MDGGFEMAVMHVFPHSIDQEKTEICNLELQGRRPHGTMQVGGSPPHSCPWATASGADCPSATLVFLLGWDTQKEGLEGEQYICSSHCLSRDRT